MLFGIALSTISMSHSTSGCTLTQALSIFTGSLRKWQTLLPYRTGTPTIMITTKFGRINYVHQETPRFDTNPSPGDYCTNGWNTRFLCLLFIYTFFLRITYRPYLLMDFHAWQVTKSCKYASFLGF